MGFRNPSSFQLPSSVMGGRIVLATDGTDQTAKLQAAINVAMGAGGNGRLFLDGDGTSDTAVVLGQLTFPNDGGTPPKQRSLIIIGQGASHNGEGGSAYGGLKLDLRFAGSPAKMDTRGLGLLKFRDITFIDTTDGTTAFIQTTNTTLDINESVEFFGKTAADQVGATYPVQDAIVLGGTSTALDGSSNAAFQGYGTRIAGAFFNRVRRIAYLRTFCNGVTIRDNTAWTGCGADTSAAAIEILGDVSNACTGNVIEGNTIEVFNYAYGMKSAFASNNTFGPNGFYDARAGNVACYRFEDTGTFNLVIDGFRNDTKPLVSESAVSLNKNTQLTSHQSQVSILPSTLTAQILQTMRSGSVVADGHVNTDQLVKFQQDEVTKTTLKNFGRTWDGGADGVGGTMKIDSGAGGSFIDILAFVTRFNTQAGALVAEILNSGAFLCDTAAGGVVLKDTQATPHYWRVTINNVGVLVTADLGTARPTA